MAVDIRHSITAVVVTLTVDMVLTIVINRTTGLSQVQTPRTGQLNWLIKRQNSRYLVNHTDVSIVQRLYIERTVLLITLAMPNQNSAGKIAVKLCVAHVQLNLRN